MRHHGKTDAIEVLRVCCNQDRVHGHEDMLERETGSRAASRASSGERGSTAAAAIAAAAVAAAAAALVATAAASSAGAVLGPAQQRYSFKARSRALRRPASLATPHHNIRRCLTELPRRHGPVPHPVQAAGAVQVSITGPPGTPDQGRAAHQ